jgi:hypothetical protein
MGTMIPIHPRFQATVPTFDKVHDELSAIQAITTILGSLPDDATRARVVRWVSERLAETSSAASIVSPADDLQRHGDRGALLLWPDSDGLRLPAADDLFVIADQRVDATELQELFEPTPAVADCDVSDCAHMAAEELTRRRGPAVESAVVIGEAAIGACEPVIAARELPALDVQQVDDAAATATSAAPEAPASTATAESMEAMLRSLVADFRSLAEEWGNT